MTTRSLGRPRSQSARRAILGAITELIERDGYGRVTMESTHVAQGEQADRLSVVADQGVGPAEALNEGAAAISPLCDTGSFDTDLWTFLRSTVAGGGRYGHLLAALRAEAQIDEDLAEAFRQGLSARDAVRQWESCSSAAATAASLPPRPTRTWTFVGPGSIWCRTDPSGVRPSTSVQLAREQTAD